MGYFCNLERIDAVHKRPIDPAPKTWMGLFHIAPELLRAALFPRTICCAQTIREPFLACWCLQEGRHPDDASYDSTKLMGCKTIIFWIIRRKKELALFCILGRKEIMHHVILKEVSVLAPRCLIYHLVGT